MKIHDILIFDAPAHTLFWIIPPVHLKNNSDSPKKPSKSQKVKKKKKKKKNLVKLHCIYEGLSINFCCLRCTLKCKFDKEMVFYYCTVNVREFKVNSKYLCLFYVDRDTKMGHSIFCTIYCALLAFFVSNFVANIF